MWPETLDCTVNRARAAAENVPWSAMATKCGELADVHYRSPYPAICLNDSQHLHVLLVRCRPCAYTHKHNDRSDTPPMYRSIEPGTSTPHRQGSGREAPLPQRGFSRFHGLARCAHSACLAVPGGTTLGLTLHTHCGTGPSGDAWMTSLAALTRRASLLPSGTTLGLTLHTHCGTGPSGDAWMTSLAALTRRASLCLAARRSA